MTDSYDKPWRKEDDSEVSEIMADLQKCMFRIGPDGRPDQSDQERVSRHVADLINRKEKPIHAVQGFRHVGGLLDDAIADLRQRVSNAKPNAPSRVDDEPRRRRQRMAQIIAAMQAKSETTTH